MSSCRCPAPPCFSVLSSSFHYFVRLAIFQVCKETFSPSSFFELSNVISINCHLQKCIASQYVSYPLFMFLFSFYGVLMRRNLTSGPSIIFHRKQVKNETLIRNNPTRVVKSIVGYDANALYLWCTAQNMPMGHPRTFRLNADNNLQKVFNPDIK